MESAVPHNNQGDPEQKKCAECRDRNRKHSQKRNVARVKMLITWIQKQTIYFVCTRGSGTMTNNGSVNSVRRDREIVSLLICEKIRRPIRSSRSRQRAIVPSTVGISIVAPFRKLTSCHHKELGRIVLAMLNLAAPLPGHPDNSALVEPEFLQIGKGHGIVANPCDPQESREKHNNQHDQTLI
jgi:hypothetical protein